MVGLHTYIENLGCFFATQPYSFRKVCNQPEKNHHYLRKHCHNWNIQAPDKLERNHQADWDVQIRAAMAFHAAVSLTDKVRARRSKIKTSSVSFSQHRNPPGYEIHVFSRCSLSFLLWHRRCLKIISIQSSFPGRDEIETYDSETCQPAIDSYCQGGSRC